VPFYEFSCTKCKHRFDTLQKSSDPPPPCPKCAALTKKLVSLTTFHLKGGGWSEDGYSTTGKKVTTE